MNNPQAESEYIKGKSFLNFNGPALALDPHSAISHFKRAFDLDRTNSTYAFQVGTTHHLAIRIFLLPWGSGPLITIASFTLDHRLGHEINQQNRIFDLLPLTEDNKKYLSDNASGALDWHRRAIDLDNSNYTARCCYAELLKDVGAFGLALQEAQAVLACQDVPGNMRQMAKDISTYITGPDSELRRYLSVEEAMTTGLPPGLTGSTDTANPQGSTGEPGKASDERPYPEDAQEQWRSIRSGPSGKLIRSLFDRARGDLSEFCRLMEERAICPQNYILDFYEFLIREKQQLGDANGAVVGGEAGSGREGARTLSDAGVEAIRSGNPGLAVERWKQAAAADPTWSVPWFNIAKCSASQKRSAEGLAALERAVAIALESGSSEDSQVLEQAPYLRAELEMRQP